MDYKEINFHKVNRRPVTDTTYQIDAEEWNALGAEIERQRSQLNRLDPNASVIPGDELVTSNMLEEYKQHVQESLRVIGADIKDGELPLITYEEFRAIQPKTFKYYYVARDEDMKEKGKCWRVYLCKQLIGMFTVDGSITLPRFPMRFPFKLA